MILLAHLALLSDRRVYGAAPQPQDSPGGETWGEVQRRPNHPAAPQTGPLHGIL